MTKLYYLTWNVTNKCNLKCKHCYANSTINDTGCDLTTSEAKELIDDAKKLGLKFMLFTGGEPLLRNDLMILMKYAKKKGIRVFLATNGILINKKNLRLMKSIIDKMNISLDSASKDIHDEIRGVKGAFEKAVKAIKLTKSYHIPVSASMTVHNRNVSELKTLAQLCTKLGIGLTIKRYISSDRGRINDLALTPTEFKKICDEIYVLQAAGNSIFFKDPIFNSKNIIHTGAINGCLAGIHIASVTNTGEVLGCTKLPYSFGNIRNTPFKRIWKKNDKLLLLRKRKLKGVCATCEHKNICGGCRAAAYQLYNDLFAQDPLCEECTK